MSILVRLGDYISKKPNFLKASVLMFGLPFGILSAVLTRNDDPAVPMFSLLLCPLAGYIWGLGMWHLYFEAVFAKKHQPTLERK